MLLTWRAKAVGTAASATRRGRSGLSAVGGVGLDAPMLHTRPQQEIFVPQVIPIEQMRENLEIFERYEELSVAGLVYCAK